MKSKLKKITYLVISLLMGLLLNNTLIFNNGAQTELNIPKRSAVDCDPITINAAATGVGANNWTWAVSQSWCSGSGTWNDPYMIENLKINGLEVMDGIYIYNSDVSFIIQDCLIYNSSAGIYLENVNNSRLINNNCSNINTGIYIDNDCYNNTISGNTANGNDNEGILLVKGDYNTITGNTVNDNHEGIRIDTSSDYNFIGGNIINDNEIVGVRLENSDYNNFTGNTANGNSNGIFLETDSNYNYIAGNIFNNKMYGMEIFYSNFNSIIGNTANDNTEYGITLEGCSNNTISGNKIYNNKDTGIDLDEECVYNDITENILRNNSLGIYFDPNCNNNSIYQNFFLENGKHAEDDGTDNTWNSTSIGNYWDNWTSPDVDPNDGIVDDPYTYIGGSPGNIDYLPIAEDGAPSVTINSPTSSDVFGVTAPSFDVTITDDYLDSMWYTIDGGINNYTFIENGIINQTAWAAKTEGSVTITFYASDIPGNIGIDEVSVVKDTTAPIIVINSPTDGEEFGTQAPFFNITVTENNLDVMWYSFDGGVTTFAIINNTVFNQTAWTALPEGDVTITFYARDLAGNEASEAVTVVKIAAGLDPGIIITIVVVSIAGGVAVAAVIFIYLKKRASPN